MQQENAGMEHLCTRAYNNNIALLFTLHMCVCRSAIPFTCRCNQVTSTSRHNSLVHSLYQRAASADSNGNAPSPAPAAAAPAPRSALDELYDVPQATSQTQPSKASACWAQPQTAWTVVLSVMHLLCPAFCEQAACRSHHVSFAHVCGSLCNQSCCQCRNAEA